MLDQSFSFENFRVILDVENRKGNYIEHKDFFKEDDIFLVSRKISDKIIDKNKDIRDEKASLYAITVKTDSDYEKLNGLLEEKEKLKEDRDVALEAILQEISEKANKINYTLSLKKGLVKFGSQLYVINNSPENYFVSKQLQRNIYKTFKVKQASRKSIISQLEILLKDGFPKIIIRTDIKSFYESIPHKQLLSKIEQNSLLSYPSKKIIKKILNQYWNILVADGIKTITDERVGIPRGIGFSAYLSELYLRSFDKKMESYPNVTFYKRYVDDIILIITPNTKNEIKKTNTYIKEIENLLLQTTKLKINTSKTEAFDLKTKKKTSKTYSLTYLGYKFIFGCKKLNKKVTWIPLKIRMSDNKLQRYKTKIELAFQDYNSSLGKYVGIEKGVSKLLLLRIKFLTNNFQLLRRKSNVFIGVYFSNEFLSFPYEDLKELDLRLTEQITLLPNTTRSNELLIEKLSKMSFEKGFKEKRIVQFSTDSFKTNKILKIWNNL